MEAQLPNIIKGLVEDNQNPREVCTNIETCDDPASGGGGNDGGQDGWPSMEEIAQKIAIFCI